MDDENKSYPIPERFRTSADITDEKAYELLKASDAAQQTLSEQIQSPFTRSSPRDIYRRKAKVMIETLSKFQPLTDEQTEQLAESYAAIGRYDLAAGTSKLNAAQYEEIWKAVFRSDADWCAHNESKMFVSEYIWSIKEGKELPLLKCSVCGAMNVKAKPASLVAASQNRAQHQGNTNGMTIQEAQAYHQKNVKKA